MLVKFLLPGKPFSFESANYFSNSKEKKGRELEREVPISGAFTNWWTIDEPYHFPIWELNCCDYY
jgi:hypothetical protein